MGAVCTVLAILSLVAVLALWIYLRYFIPLRPQEDGFEYVHVEEDGSVRELDDDEKVYLKTEFDPSDGGRPYVKIRYRQLTPDGKIWGYLPRRRVPKRIEIRK